MGSCLCKDSNENELGAAENSADMNNVSPVRDMTLLGKAIDKLVIETLDVIGTIIDNDPDPPNSILMLHVITEKPIGWIELIASLIRVIPVDHPMGPSVIALLLDDSPLPTKVSILKVADMTKQFPNNNLQNARNFCVILGCLAEKLAGPNSMALLNDITLEYLLGNISGPAIDHNVKLLSIIALEKFAQTSENKIKINKRLSFFDSNPFLGLEDYVKSDNFLLRQIGFCAKWSLDNYFIVEGRKFSYELIDVSHVNAMLNSQDVSEYLKISPDGLEARCDAYTFESVRCTYKVEKGCWYYEVLLITSGVMQIGWATRESSFLSDDGYGIGDDKYSIGFDGCRKLIWHNAKSLPQKLPAWKAGTILGCFLDLDKHEVVFSLNGETTEPYTNAFHSLGTGYFAAASFMSFQQCRFNFGLDPFVYPPQRTFNSFNAFAKLKSEDKIVLPKHIYLQLLRKMSIHDDSCNLCFDRLAAIYLEPCHHRGFCEKCVTQLKFCPMCRSEIVGIIPESTDRFDNDKEAACPDLPMQKCSIENT